MDDRNSNQYQPLSITIQPIHTTPHFLPIQAVSLSRLSRNPAADVGSPPRAVFPVLPVSPEGISDLAEIIESFRKIFG